MTFSIYTLGCKVNQYESQAMRENLVKSGFTPVSMKAEPNIIIINSCTVTAQSDHKVRQVLHRSRRENPNAIVILTGCMPQAFPKECEELEDADIILGNACRADIIPSISDFLKNGSRIISISEHKHTEKFEKMKIDNFDERTRAFVKIEDGCNRFCSYCIIPYARGRVRSKPLDELICEVKELAEAGYKEIVLVGINLSAYGSDISSNLYEAVRSVAKIDGIERIRLGSLEPYLLTDQIIEKLAEIKKFCPQFHLSLQSGCDATLKRMNRKYTSAEYKHIVDKLRSSFNCPGITTDVMVGFAGETEQEFNESLSFVKAIAFSKVHVFAYSRRKGTKAYDYPDQVTNAVKEQRSKLMIDATTKTAVEFCKSMISLSFSVLFEREIEDGIYEGYTENYIHVIASSETDLCGQIHLVEITEANGTTCKGKVL